MQSFLRMLSIRRKHDTPSRPSRSRSHQENERPLSWIEDEKKVREGRCSFQVKYLGCSEVFESRGIQVCEEAIKKLKSQCKGKRKAQRAILYVSGDALRVVDELSKGLLVDQTIEKVSFCAPDRFHERGFAYICRDGTTRRWLCHGFFAIKESGERLSHAVGCAFAICLEKKQKREREAAELQAKAQSSEGGTTGEAEPAADAAAASPSATSSTTTTAAAAHSTPTSGAFARMGSMRGVPLSERIKDPQALKPAEPPVPKGSDPIALPSTAIARPKAPEQMVELQRQRSARFFHKLQDTVLPFKRGYSMRADMRKPETTSTASPLTLTSVSTATTATSTSTPADSSTSASNSKPAASPLNDKLAKDLLAAIFDNSGFNATSSLDSSLATPTLTPINTPLVTSATSSSLQLTSSVVPTSTPRTTSFPISFSAEPILEEPEEFEASFDAGIINASQVLLKNGLNNDLPDSKANTSHAVPFNVTNDALQSSQQSSSLQPQLPLTNGIGSSGPQTHSTQVQLYSNLPGAPVSAAANTSSWVANFPAVTSTPAAMAASAAAAPTTITTAASEVNSPATTAIYALASQATLPVSTTTSASTSWDPFNNSQVQAWFSKPVTATNSTVTSTSSNQTPQKPFLISSSSVAISQASSPTSAAPSPFMRSVPQSGPAAAPSTSASPFTRSFLYSTVRMGTSQGATPGASPGKTASIGSAPHDAHDPFDVAWAARQSSRFRQSNPFAKSTPEKEKAQGLANGHSELPPAATVAQANGIDAAFDPFAPVPANSNSTGSNVIQTFEVKM